MHFFTTFAVFNRHNTNIADNLPRHWLQILKTVDPNDDELETIVSLKTEVMASTDVQYLAFKDLYRDTLYKVKREKRFAKKSKLETCLENLIVGQLKDGIFA